MALQLNNWNENRKQEAQFKSTLEQLYTTIKYDAEAFYRYSISYESRLKVIDSILDFPDSIHKNDLPFILYNLTYETENHISESGSYSNDLNYNPENQKQKEIAKEILNYINSINSFTFKVEERLKQAIHDTDVAHPKLNTEGIMNNESWDRSDLAYYSESDFKKLYDLIHGIKFKSILKSARTLSIYNHADSKNAQNDGLSIRELIKDYYPGVKVFYKDVGIIGTAIDGFDDVGAKSTPMTLVDEENSIWEITMFLKEGAVKFRCRDSWAQNWGVIGNSEFPMGNAVHDGRDIPINEAGNYQIILDLTKNKYEFRMQED